MLWWSLPYNWRPTKRFDGKSFYNPAQNKLPDFNCTALNYPRHWTSNLTTDWLTGWWRGGGFRMLSENAPVGPGEGRLRAKKWWVVITVFDTVAKHHFMALNNFQPGELSVAHVVADLNCCFTERAFSVNMVLIMFGRRYWAWRF